MDTHFCEISLGILALILRVHLIDDCPIRPIAFLPVLLLQLLDVGDVGRDFDVLEDIRVVKRVIVDDVSLLEGFAEIDAVVDDFVGDDESFRWEEL